MYLRKFWCGESAGERFCKLSGGSRGTLVTKDSFERRERYVGLRECLQNMLDHDIVPIINNNDVLHEMLTVAELDKLMASLPEDPHLYKDPGVDWEDQAHGVTAKKS